MVHDMNSETGFCWPGYYISSHCRQNSHVKLIFKYRWFTIDTSRIFNSRPTLTHGSESALLNASIALHASLGSDWNNVAAHRSLIVDHCCGEGEANIATIGAAMHFKYSWLLSRPCIASYHWPRCHYSAKHK